MRIHTIESRAITVIAYDDATRRLQVQFRDRSVYTYVDVPEPHYLGLLHAPSPGAYFNMHIRGKYRHQPSSTERRGFSLS